MSLVAKCGARYYWEEKGWGGVSADLYDKKYAMDVYLNSLLFQITSIICVIKI